MRQTLVTDFCDFISNISSEVDPSLEKGDILAGIEEVLNEKVPENRQILKEKSKEITEDKPTISSHLMEKKESLKKKEDYPEEIVEISQEIVHAEIKEKELSYHKKNTENSINQQKIEENLKRKATNDNFHVVIGPEIFVSLKKGSLSQNYDIGKTLGEGFLRFLQACNRVFL